MKIQRLEVTLGEKFDILSAYNLILSHQEKTYEGGIFAGNIRSSHQSLRPPILKNICKRLLLKQKRFNMTIHFCETNGTFFLGRLENMESVL